MLDRLLRGGTVCDGTGAPARRADVGIRGERIVAVGAVDEAARATIDADGLVVAPGFVDVHTHYDAQVTWDGLLTPSSWHGVTSAVIGNCGFSLAPCRVADRDRLLRLLEHVEGMPYESLRAGVRWSWESVSEYLAMLAAAGLGPNVGALIGHSAVRLFVMGEAAYDRAATADEIARMAAIVRDGMAAGALGFATSRSSGHVGEGGRPVPSRLASRDELTALASAMAASGRGVVEITPETFPLSAEEGAYLAELSIVTGRPVCFSAILDLPDRAPWPAVFAAVRAANARGARLVPQVSCRPLRFDFDLVEGCASLDAVPAWRRFREADDAAARRALVTEPAFRAAVRAGTIGRADAPSSRRWATVVFEETMQSADEALVGETLGAIAGRRGGDPITALLDLSAAADFRARFSMVLLNDDERRVGELLQQPESLIALSDAGAHVSTLCDAGYATHLLGRWVRERGVFGLAEGVRRLTSMPADVFGVADRGRLVPGAVADVVCFDPTTVAAHPPERVADFPGGARRYVARATGVAHVLVAGEPFLRDGTPTGARPGRVLQFARA